jgi:hypothetical protein
MEINDTEIVNDPGNLPPPRFDDAMVSEAQPVEPLPPKSRMQTFLRGRLGLLIAVMAALLMCAAAIGMVLGLRDRRDLINETSSANQASPEPSNNVETTATLKTPPAKTATRVSEEPKRTQVTDTQAADQEPVVIIERPRRSMRIRLPDFDREESGRNEQPAARKVGEIFGGRNRDRHGRWRELRRRAPNDDHDR